MQQMEEEMNLSMNQMNELAGNIQDNNIKGNKNKNKKIYLKNDNSSKGNVKNAQKKAIQLIYVYYAMIKRNIIQKKMIFLMKMVLLIVMIVYQMAII